MFVIKKLNKIFIIIFFFLYGDSRIIYSDKIDINYKISYKEEKVKDYIATFEIPKIELRKDLYKINSYKNNLNRNIQILDNSIMPDKDNSILVLAAHSGNSFISFFKNVDELELNDKILLYYNSFKYIYNIEKIYLTKKNGILNIVKNNSPLLVITTCSKDYNDKQLVIISILEKYE